MDVKDRTVLSLDELERITRRQLCTTAATGLVALVVPSCMGFVLKGAEGNPPVVPGGSGGAAGAPPDDPGTGGTGGGGPADSGGTGGIADAGSDGGGDARRANDARPDTGPERPPDAAPAAACSVGFNTNMMAASFAMGTATFFSARNTFVCRDAGGLFTVTSICTHQGCDIRFVNQASGFSCPCHGSRFSFVGAVTNGPANSPLRHFQVCVATDGRLWFDTNRTVTSTVRLQA